MNRKSLKNNRALSKSSSTNYQKLEPKHLLASIYLNPNNDILFIGGDSGNNVGQVDVVNGNVEAQIDGETFSALSSQVADIVFIGYAGNDTFTNLSSRGVSMYGHLGTDTLIGGSGDDNLVGGPGNDTIEGNEGDDRIVGATGNDMLEGGPGNDRMFGTSGINVIMGGLGDDVIYGGPQVDEIHGEDGIDQLFGLGGNDMLYTGRGGVEGGAFAQGDLAMGHGGNDVFFGDSGLDIFWGGDGDDTFNGGAGENRMHGQAGNDTLIGGAKSDYMTGADGNDIFEGRGAIDFFNVGNGSDTIVYGVDFNPSFVFVNSSGETRVQGEVVSSASSVRFNDRTISSNQANNSIQAEANFSTLNGHRISNSAGFLSKPADLAAFAQNWSQTMASQGSVTRAAQSAQQALLTGSRTVNGMNVASVADTGQSAAQIANYFHNFWANNAVDNGTMLRGDFLEVGVGIVQSGGMWWATQMYVG